MELKEKKKLLIEVINGIINAYNHDCKLSDLGIAVINFNDKYHDLIHKLLKFTDFNNDIVWWIWEAKLSPKKHNEIIVILQGGKKINITETTKFVGFLYSENYKSAKEYTFN